MSTTSRILIPAVAFVSLLVTVTGCSAIDVLFPASEPTPTTPSTASPSVDWEYTGDDGPDNWAELTEDFATCGTGAQQSPIDLPAQLPSAKADAVTIDTGLLPAVGEVVDTGHSSQFVPEAYQSSVEFDGETYELLQVHAHTPSEHTIDGEPAAAEFHFVHTDADGDLLVVGVLAVEGDANAQWQPFIESATGAADSETALNLSGLLPASSDYYAYEGSLTTPPCTEGVQWVVLQTPITLSVAQLEQLGGEHSHNARPIAPLGDREVTGGTATRD